MQETVSENGDYLPARQESPPRLSNYGEDEIFKYSTLKMKVVN